MAGLLLSAWISAQPASALAEDCGPINKTTVEPLFSEACEKLQNAYQCLSSADGGSCSNAKQVDAAAVQQIKDGYATFCAALDKYNAAKNSCSSGQAACTGDAAKALAEAKANAQKAASDFNAIVQNMNNWRQKLLDEIKDAAGKTGAAGDDGKDCRTAAHKVPDNPADSPGEKNRVTNSLVKALEAIPKSPTREHSNGSPTISGYADALSAIDKSIKQVTAEGTRIQGLANGLGGMATGNTRTNNNLGANPKSNPSDVTGTDKPSDSKTASGAPSGGAPSGGAPSGGSPSSGQQPSSLSNPSDTGQAGATAPTPASSNPGSNNAGNDGNGSNNVGGTKNGTGVVADAGGLPNQKLISPGQAPGAPIRTGGSQAAQASDSTGTSSGKRAPSAAGATAVGGGGVAAGGLGATGAGGEGKADGTGSSQAGGGTAASSSGSGGGGGGSSGGGGDEVLSPFGKPLSDPKFSLAGSDTDASVKKMLGNFDGDAAGDPNRGLASDGEISDGVGDRESADLFDRVHAYHERCQQKGCVSGLMKRKVGGA